MTSLFFQDRCGVLDVFQTCLMVFSPFSPGVHGRNWHFLELGDSLPDGCYQPARTLSAGLCLPCCPQLPLDMIKGVPPFTLVGHDSVMLCLYGALCSGLPHGDGGLKQQIP